MNALVLVLVLASRTVFSFTDPAITESSGLVDLGALMVTTNDSGDDAVLYTIDPATGDTVGTTTYAPEVTDVEALAPSGDGRTVWAADIGDNTAARRVIEVYRVPVGRGDRRVQAPSYRLSYPDGPQDAESLIAPDGRLYVITKGLLGGSVYAAPKAPDPDRTNRLTRVGSVSEFATDAAMLDPDHVIVRGYDSAEILTFPAFENVATFALPAQQQGEGISVGPDRRIRISSEGEGAAVLEIALPGDVRKALGEFDPCPTWPDCSSPGASPAPDVDRSGDDVTEQDDGPPVLGIALGAAAALLVAGWWLRRRR